MYGLKFALVCFFVVMFMLASDCVVVVPLGAIVFLILSVFMYGCFCLCAIMDMFDMIFLLFSKYVSVSCLRVLVGFEFLFVMLLGVFISSHPCVYGSMFVLLCCSGVCRMCVL